MQYVCHQLSNSRFCFKIYDKAVEQNITDKGLLRIEFCYSSRGLKYAKVGRALETFLTPDSINALLMCYRKDYKTYLIDRYWNNRDSKTLLQDEYSQPIYKEMIAIIYNDLSEHNGQPLTVAIMNKELTGVKMIYINNKNGLNRKIWLYRAMRKRRNIFMTYAEGLYRRTHKKEVESTEDYLNRVTKAYNEIYSLINKVNDSKGCIQASNEINAFRQIVGKNATDVLKLRKQLINRIETVLEDNDTKIQDLKQKIKDIQSFDVSDTMEEATKLDRLATNRMYELMISFNGNSNSTKRKLGNIILNKNGLDRISATALSRLCAIPAYADFFKPSYKEIIAEAMKSDAQKTYERNSQPVIEEKNRAIGKTYMSNFLLRKALSMAVSSDEVTNNE